MRRSPFSLTSQTLLIMLIGFIAPLSLAYVAIKDLPTNLANDSQTLIAQRDLWQLESSLISEQAKVRSQAAIFAAKADAYEKITLGQVPLPLLLGTDPTEDYGPLSQAVTVASQGRKQEAVLYQPLEEFLKKPQASGQIQSEYNIKNAKGILVVGKKRPLKAKIHTTGEFDTYTISTWIDDASTAQITSERKENLFLPLILLAFAAAMAAFIATILIGQKITKASMMARSLAKGRYDLRLPVTGSDSFAHLASNFNTLAGELQGKISTLENVLQRFEDTVEAISDGVCVWHKEEVLIWNKAAQSMTGLSKPEGQVKKSLLDARAVGEDVITLNLESGGQIQVHIQTTITADGLILQTFRDVGREQKLRKLKKDFMATAAHELRTPLTSVYGFAQTLDGAYDHLEESQRRSFISLIVQESEKMRSILAAFQRSLQAEDINVNAQNINLHHLLQELPLDNVVIEGLSPDMKVQADREVLGEIILILHENAQLYASAPFTLQFTPGKDCMDICYKDAGGGLSLEESAHVFEPFYRVDVQMKKHPGGMGLGLYLAKNFAVAMGGELTLDSSYTNGAAFCLKAPLA